MGGTRAIEVRQTLSKVCSRKDVKMRRKNVRTLTGGAGSRCEKFRWSMKGPSGTGQAVRPLWRQAIGGMRVQAAGVVGRLTALVQVRMAPSLRSAHRSSEWTARKKLMSEGGVGLLWVGTSSVDLQSFQWVLPRAIPENGAGSRETAQV